jgi:hypothetical protein
MSKDNGWADFHLPEEIQNPSASYDHYGKLAPLEQLAWAEMDEDEFVERVAAQVWRRPKWYGISGGRVGVSRSKTKRFMVVLGKHIPPREKKRVGERVYDRALELFDLACKGWAAQALSMVLKANEAGAPIRTATIKSAVRVAAPKGGFQPTLDIIYASLAEED